MRAMTAACTLLTHLQPTWWAQGPGAGLGRERPLSFCSWGNAAQVSNQNTNKTSQDSFHLEFKHLLCNHAGTTVAWMTRDAGLFSIPVFLMHLQKCHVSHAKSYTFLLRFQFYCTVIATNWLRMVPILCFAGKSKLSLRLLRVTPKCVIIALPAGGM